MRLEVPGIGINRLTCANTAKAGLAACRFKAVNDVEEGKPVFRGLKRRSGFAWRVGRGVEEGAVGLGRFEAGLRGE